MASKTNLKIIYFTGTSYTSTLHQAKRVPSFWDFQQEGFDTATVKNEPWVGTISFVQVYGNNRTDSIWEVEQWDAIVTGNQTKRIRLRANANFLSSLLKNGRLRWDSQLGRYVCAGTFLWNNPGGLPSLKEA